MASVISLGLSSYLPISGNLRVDNYELNARYAITPAWSISGAYTFPDGAYSSSVTTASPAWHRAMLQTDYSLSKRTDLYLEGVYQHVHGAPAGSTIGEAMINTLSPSSTGTQVAVTVGMRRQF